MASSTRTWVSSRTRSGWLRTFGFYFKVGDDDWVRRQVELEGPARRPIVAASAGDDDARYGFTAELPVTDWEGHVEEPLTIEEFEDVWAAARRHLTASEA